MIGRHANAALTGNHDGPLFSRTPRGSLSPSETELEDQTSTKSQLLPSLDKLFGGGSSAMHDAKGIFLRFM